MVLPLYPQKAALLNLTDVVRATIQHHRDIWITEADFVMMAKVRLLDMLSPARRCAVEFTVDEPGASLSAIHP